MSCARPKYVQVMNQASNDNSVGETQAECRQTFSKSGLCLVWYWEKKPTSVKDEGILIFKSYHLNAHDQTAVETDMAASPHIVLWMPDMGHGSRPTVTHRLDVGTYRVSKIYFSMTGEWDIHFQSKNGSEVIDETAVRLVISF